MCCWQTVYMCTTHVSARLQVQRARAAEAAKSAAAAQAQAEAAEARRSLAVAQGALAGAEGLEAELAAARERARQLQQQHEARPELARHHLHTSDAQDVPCAGEILHHVPD